MTETLALPAVNLRAIAPAAVLAVTGFILMLLDLVPPRHRREHMAFVGLAGVAAALVATVLLWSSNDTGFQGMVVLDNFALFMTLVIGYATGLVLLLSIDYLQRRGMESGEFYILVLFAATGMVVMAGANDLIVVFLGLETMSLALYVLAGIFRTREAGEASMKYFLLGAFASGFFLYGIALIYGATGSTNLNKIGAAVAAGSARDPLLLIGFGLLLVGFGFKISAVPFHMWTADVYEGAPTSVTALIATGSKAAAFAALLRVLLEALRPLQAEWTWLFWGLAVLSMTLGNVVAIAQQNLKRMLAYSSIAHVGYMLVGIVAGGSLGNGAVLFYLLVYTFTTAGAFGLILLLERGGEEAVSVGDTAGLAARHPPGGARHDRVPALARRHPAHGGLRRQVLPLRRGRPLGLHLAGGHRRAQLGRGRLLLPARDRHDVHARSRRDADGGRALVRRRARAPRRPLGRDPAGNHAGAHLRPRAVGGPSPVALVASVRQWR